MKNPVDFIQNTLVATQHIKKRLKHPRNCIATAKTQSEY